jgi:indolepyruvate decarboxylase
MPTVSDFLLERMKNAGIKTVFGCPGDYILNFCKKISDDENIDFIGNTDENHAGFAADAHARCKGIGCVVVTYNVGALKITNAVACAYAERSPVVIISGSPGMKERGEGVLLHHMVRSFECQKDIFENITCASIVLDDPTTAGYKIDKAFESLKHHKQPIYIELPRDIAEKSISYDVYKQGTPESPKSDKENLQEALSETISWITSAERPVILAGVQLSRYGLHNELIKFAERTNIPVATTLLSKSVVDETHPLFAGIYAGTASQKGTKKLVEDSDCLLMFGVLVTDMTLSFKPAKFTKRQVVSCTVEGLKIKNHTFTDVVFKDFCETLFKTDVPRLYTQKIEYKNKLPANFIPIKENKITCARFFEKVQSFLDNKMIVIADVGDSLFGAIDLNVRARGGFISPAFYTSMGFAIPGALGAQTAKPDHRPIVLLGDGSFQMSCTELSTIVSKGLNPVVFILDNKGYTTERFLLDGPFNDISNWNYHKITEVFGGVGHKVETEGELEDAVSYALKSNVLNVISVQLGQKDISPALVRMTEGLAKRV